MNLIKFKDVCAQNDFVYTYVNMQEIDYFHLTVDGNTRIVTAKGIFDIEGDCCRELAKEIALSTQGRIIKLGAD